MAAAIDNFTPLEGPRLFEMRYCKKCGAEISNELCTWDCPLDSSSLKERAGEIMVRVVERTCRIVEERTE